MTGNLVLSLPNQNTPYRNYQPKTEEKQITNESIIKPFGEDQIKGSSTKEVTGENQIKGSSTNEVTAENSNDTNRSKNGSKEVKIFVDRKSKKPKK